MKYDYDDEDDEITIRNLCIGLYSSSLRHRRRSRLLFLCVDAFKSLYIHIYIYIY
jgi:hypothetical protein